jgi:hypothetical protein
MLRAWGIVLVMLCMVGLHARVAIGDEVKSAQHSYTVTLPPGWKTLSGNDRRIALERYSMAEGEFDVLLGKMGPYGHLEGVAWTIVSDYDGQRSPLTYNEVLNECTEFLAEFGDSVRKMAASDGDTVSGFVASEKLISSRIEPVVAIKGHYAGKGDDGTAYSEHVLMALTCTKNRYIYLQVQTPEDNCESLFMGNMGIITVEDHERLKVHPTDPDLMADGSKPPPQQQAVQRTTSDRSHRLPYKLGALVVFGLFAVIGAAYRAMG